MRQLQARTCVYGFFQSIFSLCVENYSGSRENDFFFFQYEKIKTALRNTILDHGLI